ncbi:MAG: hypothetical protein V2A62_02250 [Candidatus Woesearchaeota archaeon]
MRKRGKKGQVSVFIIIGILMVLVFWGIFWFNSTISTEGVKGGEVSVVNFGSVVTDIEPAKQAMERCLEYQLKNIIFYNSLQGGYFTSPIYSVENNVVAPDLVVNIPYYLFESQPRIIDKDTLKTEISTGIILELETCLDLVNSTNTLVSVKREMAKVEVKITSFNIILDLYLPIIISNGGTYSEIDYFNVRVPSKLNLLHDIASEISLTQSTFNDSICMTCLSNLADENKIDLRMNEIQDKDKHIIIYSLVVFGDNEIFNFAHEFNLSSKKKSALEVGTIGTLEAKADYPFYYQVNASGEEISFLDYSSLFEINSIGEIKFVPREEDVGDYVTTIKVEDKYGNFDEETFILKVEGSHE